MEQDVGIIVSAIATVITILKWLGVLAGLLLMCGSFFASFAAGKDGANSRIANFFLGGIVQMIFTWFTYFYTGWVNHPSINAIHVFMSEANLVPIIVIVTAIFSAVVPPQGKSS